MKAVVEFIPNHLAKAVDLSRHIATFANLEFTASGIQMRIVDPGKAVYMDLMLIPDIYKCDEEFIFGVNLHMFYKLLRSLDNNSPIEIETDGSVMKLDQLTHHHTLVHQEIGVSVPQILEFSGPKITIPTKLFQKHVRSLGNIALAFELNYVPHADTVFLESVNSLYRTLFSIDTSITPNPTPEEEYRKAFMIKFVNMGIHPGLADMVSLTLGDQLLIGYEKDKLSVLITIASYTEA